MKTLYISYTVLKEYFIASNFKEPIQTEVYYTEDDKGWDIEFVKNSYYIHCRVNKADLFLELAEDHPEEEETAKINTFETIFLRNAIKIDSFEKPEKEETPEEETPEEIPVTTPALTIPAPENELEPRVDYV